jgi:signal transduction histidine kinase
VQRRTREGDRPGRRGGWGAGATGVDVGDPRLPRLLDAVAAVAEGRALEEVLERLVASACALVDARYGALGVLDDGGTRLVRFFHRGITPVEAAAIGPLPTGRGLLGHLIRDPRPLRLEDMSSHHASIGLPDGHPPMRSFLGAPIIVQGEVYGNLYLAEKSDGTPFDLDDERAVVALATIAGGAVAAARLNERSRELVLIRERDRIARDLHDTVIQNLYATGLGLESARRFAEGSDLPEGLSERIERAMDRIHATVHEIRTTIFALQDHGPEASVGLRAQVLAVVEELAPLLGVTPRVRLDGPIDTAVPRAVADDLLPVLRESLTNVAKHAGRVGEVAVALVATATEVALEVVDDGAGPRRRPRLRRDGGGLGLANLRARAEAWGGTFAFGSAPGGGTRVLWRAPL